MLTTFSRPSPSRATLPHRAGTHPLRETIMRQTGFTPQDRRRFLQRTYTRARDLIGYQWKTEAVGPEAF